MTFTIRLIERGPPQFILSADWTAYDLELPMRSLAEKSVIKLVRTPTGVLLFPERFVGEMRIMGATLVIEPKSPTLLSAMQALALRATSKQARHFDPKIIPSTDQKSPAAAFVLSLVRALEIGIPWVYWTISKATSYPRGKIDFVKSIAHFGARGIRHRVIVAVHERIQEGELVRLVRTAYGCLQSAPDASTKLLGDAGILIAAFDPASPFDDLHQAATIARSLLARKPAFAKEIQQLIVCCLDLIEQQYAMAGAMQAVPGGVARFQNLERLWELCILRLVECCPLLSADTDVLDHGLSKSEVRLFPDGGPTIDPDIVLKSNGNVSAVIDAKYKMLAADDSSASDLYQLAGYVGSASARLGVLVAFTEDEEDAVLVGTTEDGVPIISASVSPLLLFSEGEHALAKLFIRSDTLAEAIKKSFAQCVS